MTKYMWLKKDNGDASLWLCKVNSDEILNLLLERKMWEEDS